MIRIDILPDNVLLDIVDFYVNIESPFLFKVEIERWQSLVHVCRRWRSLVFGSPRRLNLRLYCTPKTPVRDTLDVWPALPLIVWGSMTPSSGVDDVVVALEQGNRVCQLSLQHLAERQLDKLLAAMQVSFQELTRLRLFSDSETSPVVPDSFLGGSAPHLRTLELEGIPFPGLPKLLLSATHLVYLQLSNIPHSGYISPETMVALLSVLSSLQWLTLRFQSPQSRPDWVNRRPPPSKHTVIPALNRFVFKGVIEYLEDLVTFIDVPQLDLLNITFFNQIDFDAPRLVQFISRTPILADCDAHVLFEDRSATVRHSFHLRDSTIEISCREPDWQLSSVAQVSNTCLPPLSRIEDLYIWHLYSQLIWKSDAIENTLWLELLLSFPAVKNLYLPKEFAPGIAAALQEIVGTEVLPSLQKICVEGYEPLTHFQKNTRQFVAARELSGHSITISLWDGRWTRRRRRRRY